MSKNNHLVVNVHTMCSKNFGFYRIEVWIWG